MPVQIEIPKPYIYEFEIPPLEDEKRNTPKMFFTNQYCIGKIILEMKNGYSPIIMICGKQRIGKSFVALMIANLVSTAFGKKLNVSKQCFYEPYQVIKSLDGVTHEARMIDESGAMLGRRQWWEQTHSAMEKMIQTQGYKTMCFIFVSPFVQDIDKVFTKHFDIIIHVTYRGRYKAWKTHKKYHKIEGKPSTLWFLDDVKYNLRDLPSKLWNEYEKFSFSEKERLRLKYETMKEQKKEKGVSKWAKFVRGDYDN